MAIRVPLTQGFYEARSVIAAAQRCLNLYPEKNPQGEPASYTHYPTPGLTRLGIPPVAGTVRGLYRATNNELFAAIDDQVYFVDEDFTFTSLGTTAVGTTPVKMGDNGLDMVIVDGSAFGWSVNLGSHAFAAIADPDFYGSNFVENMDTYLLFNKPGTPIFYSSDSSALTFDPLWFAAKSGYADYIGGIAVQNRNLWLIGAQATSEIWFDSGAADFPFQIMPGPFIEHGTIATYSIAKISGSILWLAQNAAGTAYVVQGVDLSAKKISTPAIEATINSYGTVSDAVAFTYEQYGHAFYWLKFPSANGGLGADWVYDLTTQLWHERSWMNPDTCEQEGHRAFCHAFCYGLNIVGDKETGQLYMLDPNNPTDAGDFVMRERAWPHMMATGERLSFPSFVADMQPWEPGVTSPGASPPSGLVSTTTYPVTVTVIDTTFTAPDGVTLSDYFNPWGLIDVGSQYSLQSYSAATAEIESDKLIFNATGLTEYVASGVPTSADYVGYFEAHPNVYDAVPAADTEVYIVTRATIDGEGYVTSILSDGAQYRFYLQVYPDPRSYIDAGTLTSGYFKCWVLMVEDNIKTVCQRTEDDYYLASDGTWQADFTTAHDITDSTYADKGYVLVGGYAP